MADWLETSIDDVNLRQSVQDLMRVYPASTRIIERMVRYYDNKPTERDAKRRKLEESALLGYEVLRILDVSFQSPVRKRLDLVITNTHLLLYNSKTQQVEHPYILADISSHGGACVPTPDKASKGHTFVLFLKQEDCIVFSTQDKADITIRVPDKADQTLAAEKHEAISSLITEHTRVPITQPSKEYFRSTGVSPSTGKPEDRSHVLAYLKAKDGFLFFLPTGILFGFKKPTLFFPATSLASNVITNITQRTFDLTVTLKRGAPIFYTSGFKTTREGDDETVQFSMIEQLEYGGIEAYTKKLEINDQSMSEERKAASAKKEEIQNEDSDNDQDVKMINTQDDYDEENDEDFEPSDDDNEPLEYDTDAEEDETEEVEADKELEQEETHEAEDAESEELESEDEEEELQDESD